MGLHLNLVTELGEGRWSSYVGGRKGTLQLKNGGVLGFFKHESNSIAPCCSVLRKLDFSEPVLLQRTKAEKL